MKKVNKHDGFTLIEVLVVIGIIALLASIVIVAINPAKQFAQARNTQRQANVSSILNAVGQRLVDNKGVFAGTFEIDGKTYHCGLIPSDPTTITSTEATNPTDQTGNLGCLIPTYISALPTEPKGVTAEQYTIEYKSGGRIEVCAPESENEDALVDTEMICATR